MRCLLERDVARDELRQSWGLLDIAKKVGEKFRLLHRKAAYEDGDRRLECHRADLGRAIDVHDVGVDVGHVRLFRQVVAEVLGEGFRGGDDGGPVFRKRHSRLLGFV